jgi:RNA polymerase sigma-70 factor (ECF subfamily)
LYEGLAPSVSYKKQSQLSDPKPGGNSEVGGIAVAVQFANLEDRALIAMAMTGQTECFTVLVDRHMAAVRSHIIPIVQDRTDVDDVLQEVLLKVWLHLSTFRSESSFRTWMTRVAINEALQARRRQRHRPVCQAYADFDGFASANESPLQSIAGLEMVQTVRRSVAGLPAMYRQVMNLREFEGLTVREIVSVIQSTIPAVKTRLIRARSLLQRSRIRDWATCRVEENASRCSPAVDSVRVPG